MPVCLYVCMSVSVSVLHTSVSRYVHTVLDPANLRLYFPDLVPRPSHSIVGFAWWQGWNDGGDAIAAGNYEENLVNLIRSVRRDFNNSRLAVSVPVSGFHGWNDTDFRRQQVLQAQFAACDPKRHPEAQPAIAEETRDFWRDQQYSPSPQAFHFYHNAETYWLTGKAMARGMLQLLLNRPRPLTPPPPPPPSCDTDFDCSGGNGHCDRVAKTCACHLGWKGLLCNQLAFKPRSARVSYRSAAWTGSGSPIRERVSTSKDHARHGGAETQQFEYHLFSSRMRNGCGLQHHDINSEIVHLTSPNATGPYTIPPHAPNGGVALGEFDSAGGAITPWDIGSPYAPSVHRLPNGSYVMFYQAMLRASGQPAAQDCLSNSTVYTNHSKANATVGSGDGRRIGIALADSLDGPWRRSRSPLFYDSTPPGPNDAECVDEQDPAVLIRNNGSVLIMYNCNDWRGKGPMLPNVTGGRGPQVRHDQIFLPLIHLFWHAQSTDKVAHCNSTFC